ncbi:MAG: SMP-30/gluconolactonase/LRE family protein [Nannocystis sp.]|nr:SMP-30/gluconolactonase/LRE family protein [Nannocystis sp.]
MGQAAIVVKKMRAKYVALGLVGLVVGYLGLWPVDAAPAAWTPTPASASEVHALNERLAGHSTLHPGLVGAEAVTFDREGRIVTGLLDGSIMRFAPDGSGAPEKIADTGGRPLGLRYDAEGALIVADARRGLVEVGREGAVRVLADAHDGVPIRFADDLAIARDGTIYFSDASSVRSVEAWRVEVIEHRANGRLLVYEPSTRTTRLLLGDLHFANGVALGRDEASVVVTELSEYRVRRVWLTGPRAGAVEALCEGLPGFPDNITWSAERGVFWVALGSPRNPLVDGLAGWPGLRRAVLRLPEALQPAPERHGWVIAIDEAGAVVHDLQFRDERAYSPVSSVVERDGWLFLGSFAGAGIAKVRAPG